MDDESRQDGLRAENIWYRGEDFGSWEIFCWSELNQITIVITAGLTMGGIIMIIRV